MIAKLKKFSTETLPGILTEQRITLENLPVTTLLELLNGNQDVIGEIARALKVDLKEVNLNL